MSEYRTIRPWDELRSTGLLWLINAAVLHPRGFAMAVVLGDDGLVVGWTLLGDGTEPWTFAEGLDKEPFAAVEAFLNAHRTTPPLLRQPELTEEEAEEIKKRFLAAFESDDANAAGQEPQP